MPASITSASHRSLRNGSSKYTGSIGSDKSDELKELDFSPFLVDSRTQALESLGSVYRTVKSPSSAGELQEQSLSHSNLILISGVSGTGKSTLVDQFVNEVNKKSDLGKDTKPHFLMGKYNKKSSSDPYSAIITAFSDFAKGLTAEGELGRLRDLIQEKVGDEAQLLIKVIPELAHFLGAENAPAASCSEEDDDNEPSENAWDQLKYIFQAFVSAISTEERPLVLFLDDLQWIDDASLKLISSLLIDADLKHFMFIGAYRSDEVNSGDPLWNTLERVQMVQEFETIQLTNLCKSEIMEFVIHMLCLERQRQKGNPKHAHNLVLIDELVDILHKKTDGNLFFASQTIKELEERAVLTFSLFSTKWELDWTNVDKSEFLTDDVMKMVTGKIKQSSDLLQQILKTMAYTKSPIAISLLQELMEGNGVKVSLNDLVETLDVGTAQGLLSHKIGSPVYSFAHDKIQEAANSLIPEGESRREYRSLVGKQLLKMYNRAKLTEDWMLFVAADHLNAARENESEFLFHLNVKTGEKAASVAAYDTSAKFLRRALVYITNQSMPWKSTYDLSLRTHQSLAEVLLLQGEYEDGKDIARTLLDNAKTIDDKLPTVVALSVAIGKEQKQKESMDVSLGALRNLKEYPSGSAGMIAGILADLTAVKRFFKKNSDDDILKLPVMKDERKRRVMQLLNSTMYQAQFSGETLISISTTLKMLRVSFKSGLCMETVIALTLYSIIVDSLNDIDGRKRFVKLCIKVMKKTKARDAEGCVCFVATHYFGCWNQSVDDILSTFSRGYTKGMEYGRYGHAFLSASSALVHKHISGFPLPAMLLEYEGLHRKMRVYSDGLVDAFAWETHNVCRVLAGAEALDFFTLYDFKNLPYDPSQYINRKYRCLGGMQLGLYFGNLEFCVKMIAENRRLPDHDKSFSVQTQSSYYSSLCFSSLYVNTKKKSYLRKAKKCYKCVTAMVSPRGENGRFRCKIMKVHLEASQRMGACSDVKQMYDEIIAEAADNGHKHDAGLIAQLAADFFSHHDDRGKYSKKKRDTDISRTYLEQARDFYKTWGANAVVGYVEDRIESGGMVQIEGLESESREE